MSKRDEIIESAFLLFLDYGIENVPMTKIMEKANISNGGFFHYFKTKNDLIIEVMETYIHYYFNIPSEKTINSKVPTIDKIKLYYSKSIRYDLNKKEFNNITYSGKKIYYKKLAGLFLSIFRKYKFLKDNYNNTKSNIINIVKKFIDDDIKSGKIKENIDSNEMSTIIFALYMGDLVSWVASDDLNLFDSFSNHLDQIWEKLVIKN